MGNVESMQSTCSQKDSDGKERCASERWGACNAPVGGQMVVERGRCVSERWGACNAPVGGQTAVERGRCASERRRACNEPVAKPIVVEGGGACQREAESVQSTCSWTDSGRVCNRERGISSNYSARRSRVTDDDNTERPQNRNGGYYRGVTMFASRRAKLTRTGATRSEEHTSELQSRP